MLEVGSCNAFVCMSFFDVVGTSTACIVWLGSYRRLPARTFKVVQMDWNLSQITYMCVWWKSISRPETLKILGLRYRT